MLGMEVMLQIIKSLLITTTMLTIKSTMATFISHCDDGNGGDDACQWFDHSNDDVVEDDEWNSDDNDDLDGDYDDEM